MQPRLLVLISSLLTADSTDLLKMNSLDHEGSYLRSGSFRLDNEHS